MRLLHEVLENGTIPELRARRRSAVAYRDVLAKDPYCKDEMISVECDIMDINDRLSELEAKDARL